MPPIVAREIPIERTRALRHAILRAHEPLERLAAEEPPDAYAAGAFDGDELVGVGFVLPDGPPGSWRVRGMATAPHARGRGAGAAVLALLIAHARERGGTRVWCNARSPARAFYERAGLRASSAEFEIEPIGPHYVMEGPL